MKLYRFFFSIALICMASFSLPTTAYAKCVNGNCFCVVSDCSCWMCSGDAFCEYCNIFGCNCSHCSDFASCPPSPLPPAADETVEAPDGTSFPRPRFTDLDTDNNGELSQAEFLTWAENNPKIIGYYGKAPATQLFAVMDKDNNGVVSFAETGCNQLK